MLFQNVSFHQCLLPFTLADSPHSLVNVLHFTRPCQICWKECSNDSVLLNVDQMCARNMYLYIFVSLCVLSGYKIPVIENLGATLDQFDTIDFSDNEIRKLDGFPLLRRLKTLLMNNNRLRWVHFQPQFWGLECLKYKF